MSVELGQMQTSDDNKTKVKQASSLHDLSDDKLLEALGYKEQLYRGLGAFSNFAIGVTEVNVIASITIILGTALEQGGSAMIVWGFLTVWIFMQISAISLAEICSAYPSAGSVYHWAAQVVPEPWAPFWSYVTGIFNFIGNAAGDASFAFGFAQLFDSALHASGVKPYQAGAETVMVSLLVIIIWSLLNFARIDKVGWIQIFAVYFQIASIFVVCISILVMQQPLNDAKSVFGGYYNASGLSDDTNAAHGGTNRIMLGFLGLQCGLFAFVGFEAPAHLAEETTNSTVNAPKGIIYTVLVSGLFGIFYYICLLFACTDIEAVLSGESDDDSITLTDYASTNIFILACGQKGGAGLTWLIVINLFFAGLASVAVTGRITFALMRDKLFPGSAYFSQTTEGTASPFAAIALVCVIDLFLQLLPLNVTNGNVAFNSIIALCNLGFYVSYALPVFLKLVYQPKDFPVTKMDLGKWSNPLAAITSIWLFGTSFIYFFPNWYPIHYVTTNETYTDDAGNEYTVTVGSDMNWLIVVVSGFFILFALNWIFSARYHFTGPKRIALSSTDVVVNA